MAPIEKFVPACLACRDVWHELAPKENPRGQRFTAFVKWVMSVHADQTTPTPPPVHALLTLLVPPNTLHSYPTETLTSKLATQSNARNFRVVLGVDVIQHDKDNRVRKMVEIIFAEDIIFRPYTLICSFFADRSPKNRHSSGTDKFETSLATTFQRLLFISAIAHLSATLRTSKAKRRKLTAGAGAAFKSPKRIPSLDSLRDPFPQRVGSVVQQIDNGWTELASSLGFRNTEHMLAPYIRFRRPDVRLEVLNRAEGFVPLAQSAVLDIDSTLDREVTCRNAFDRSPILDGHLRHLAKEFVSDIVMAIESSSLYTTTAESGWSRKHAFTGSASSLPPRFDALGKPMLDSMKHLLGLDPPTGLSPSPSPRAPEQDYDAPAARTSRSSSQSAVAPLPLLSDQAMRARMETVESAMAPFVRTYECSFEELAEVDEAVGSTDALSGNVQLILTDPPYNIRKDMGTTNAEHDVLTSQQMGTVVDTVDALLRQGGHAIVFCSAQQFPKWERYFARHSTAVGRDDESTPTFAVDRVPIVFAKSPSFFTTNPARKTCTLASSTEFAVHVKKNGLPFKEELAMVNYVNFNYVASNYPGFKNVVNNVNRLLPGEQVRVPKVGSDATCALRPEQKSLALLKELIARFSQPGDLVVDLFAGTFSAAIACFSLPNHRRFVGCELDPACYSHSAERVLRRFATATSLPTTDIVLADEDLAAASDIHQHYEAPRIQDPKWCAPKGLPQYQQLPPHLLAHLASVWNDPPFLNKCIKLPVHEWPRTYQGLLQQVDVESLRLVDVAANSLMIAKSTIKHPNAGLGIFAAKTFQPGDIVASYFGTLVYSTLRNRREKTKTYGTGILGVDPQRFRNYAMQVPVSGNAFREVKGSSDGRKSVFIVPPPFCSASYINDYRYGKLDQEYSDAQSGKLPNARTSNVNFIVPTRSATQPARLLAPDFIVIEACQLINPGEELFANYDMDNFASEE